MASTTLVTLNPAAPGFEVADQGVCRPEHCFHAFDALYCALTDSEPIPHKFQDDKYPLFVTWSTRSSRPGRASRLRGCIGNFQAMPLREGIAEYALTSAFEDSRFNKIERWELENLECDVSLLTNYEDVSSYLDWTIGVHGIYISFPYPTSSSDSLAPSPLSSSTSIPTRRTLKHTFTATYLPQIAPEQGWDKLETIDSAIRKAGWNGRITEDLRRSIKLRRYQSAKCSVSWEEYVLWRKDNGGEV
ncbi:alport syndrome [Irpex rosettiformis]|uniref:Alport syndrome n=1 Tax=Irpex rosettiformis TaxID=378272 RepID=A0ACB8UCB2_9APHY|nr:alport syndrome [Irpex rosettiformis]